MNYLACTIRIRSSLNRLRFQWRSYILEPTLIKSTHIAMPVWRGQTKTALKLGSSFVRAQRQKPALRRVFIFHLTLLRASRRRNLEAEPRSCFIILPNIKKSAGVCWEEAAALAQSYFLFRFIRPFCPRKQSCESGGAALFNFFKQG